MVKCICLALGCMSVRTELILELHIEQCDTEPSDEVPHERAKRKRLCNRLSPAGHIVPIFCVPSPAPAVRDIFHNHLASL